jgi:hypothetical protein
MLEDDVVFGFFESLPPQLKASRPAPAATPPAMNLRRRVRLVNVGDQYLGSSIKRPRSLVYDRR